jgi:hypothetical protein
MSQFAPDPAPVGLRQAALVLHGLAQDDRDWLLAQLPEASAEDIRPLLVELQALGVPGDPELIRVALQRKVEEVKALQPGFHALAAASVHQMLELLADEPDTLIAIVLSSSNWSWRDALLSRLGDERARSIRESMLGLSVAPGLRQAVLAEVSRLAEESAAHEPVRIAAQQAPSRGLRSLRGRIGERLRAWRR